MRDRDLSLSQFLTHVTVNRVIDERHNVLAPNGAGVERAGLHRAGGHTDGDHQLHGRKTKRSLYAGVSYRFGPPHRQSRPDYQRRLSGLSARDGSSFGHDVDFTTLVKHYAVEGTATDAAHRYSPSKVTGTERTVIRGRPATEHISTSYVERFNLSSRMQMRRFTRFTNGFCKKLANHRAAIALWVRFYNLCRVHETLAHDASDGP